MTVSLARLVPLVVLLVGASSCAVPGPRGTGGDGATAVADTSVALADRETVRSVGAPWVCPDAPLEPRFEGTLFVGPDGSDSNDGRSPDAPLATLQAAADRAAPGDVVWVGEGVYSSDVEITASGTAESPIVFESRPGECAVLDGSSVEEGRRVTLNGTSHVIFRNFVIRNSPAEGIYLVDADENELSNLEIHDNYYSGITNVDGDRNLVHHVIAHHNRDASGGDADGISISSGDRNHIAYCVAYDNSDDGVDTWRSTNTLVERCIAFRNGDGGGDGMGFKAGGRAPAAGTVVRNSIAFANASHGFDYNGGRRVVFDHNTSFDNGAYGFVATGATLRANLAAANDEGPWYGETRGGSSTGNSWQSGGSAAAFMAESPGAPDFLSLAARGGDVGALGPGETIADAFGIDVATLVNP